MEDRVIARLLADATVAGIVSDRVWPGRVPQGSSLPAVVVTLISAPRLMTDDGPVGLVDARLQVDCWAESYTQARTLAHGVRDSLSGYSATDEGEGIHLMTLDDERDLNEGGSDEASYPFRRSLDFTFWHSEGD